VRCTHEAGALDGELLAAISSRSVRLPIRRSWLNAKGNGVVEAVKALQAQGGRGKSFLPEKLAHYLEQRIVLASWYPLEDYAEILRAMMKGGGGPGIPARRWAATRPARTWRAPTARFSKNADRKAAFSCSLVDVRHGELRVVERDAGHAVVELLNFALPTREICDTFTGYQRSACRSSASRTSMCTHTSAA